MRKSIARKIKAKRRVSANIIGTDKRPRINVFRSNLYLYAQAISDEKKQTLAAYSTRHVQKEKDYKKITKTKQAFLLGERLAEKLLTLKISEAVFDRSCYIYKGRVKAVAEGLRSGKIKI